MSTRLLPVWLNRQSIQWEKDSQYGVVYNNRVWSFNSLTTSGWYRLDVADGFDRHPWKKPMLIWV